jgi:hypothetical protein
VVHNGDDGLGPPDFVVSHVVVRGVRAVPEQVESLLAHAGSMQGQRCGWLWYRGDVQTCHGWQVWFGDLHPYIQMFDVPSDVQLPCVFVGPLTLNP